MTKGTLLPEIFNSPTYGRLAFPETLRKILWFMGRDPKGSYEIIVGSDSEAQNGSADFVSAIIVHKKGKGGVYFWGRQKFENFHSLRQRIWQEALISLALAEKLVEDLGEMGMFDISTRPDPSSLSINPEPGRKIDLNLEIHVDIGPNGPTREMISDIVGMIRANGFKVATKPASWGASHVADRHV